MPYIYNDEDNAPMNDVEDPIMKYTTYQSREEMESAERGELDIPFSDPPQDGCWNCRIYNGDYCTKLWNNLDECYKDTDRDAREPSDICDDWEHDEDAVWEQFFGFEED